MDFPIADAPDRNVLINHRHTGSDRTKMAAMTSFTFEKTRAAPAPAFNTSAYSWLAEAGTSLASGPPRRRRVGLRKLGQ